jgi:hypothetical protein
MKSGSLRLSDPSAILEGIESELLTICDLKSNSLEPEKAL